MSAASVAREHLPVTHLARARQWSWSFMPLGMLRAPRGCGRVGGRPRPARDDAGPGRADVARGLAAPGKTSPSSSTWWSRLRERGDRGVREACPSTWRRTPRPWHTPTVGPTASRSSCQRSGGAAATAEPPSDQGERDGLVVVTDASNDLSEARPSASAASDPRSGGADQRAPPGTHYPTVKISFMSWAITWGGPPLRSWMKHTTA